MPTFAEWYEGNEMTASLESAFTAGAREWREECENTAAKLARVHAELKERGIHLLSKDCWCEPVTYDVPMACVTGIVVGSKICTNCGECDGTERP